MRRELVDTWLRAVKPPTSGRLELWDTRAIGLVLRITPSGTATWAVRGRTTGGKRTRAKLGTWPAVGIAEARKRALRATAAIQDGGDPVAERRAARADRVARSALPTVTQRFAEWQAAKTEDKAKPWSVRHAKEVRRIGLRDITPALGKRPLAETTRSDWTALIATKRKTAPAMASLLYRVCAAFLGHAEANGWIAAPLLPRKGLASLAPPSKARARILTDAELRAVWIAAGDLNPKPRGFVRLLILTATRELEVADIAVGEIDRSSNTWTIPAKRAKNGRAITIPLPALALAELLPLWPKHAAGSAWRLLGDVAGNGIRGFSKVKSTVDALSGVTGWRWHDVRRSARTGMSRLGVPRDHAEAALNHVSGRSALERIYDRHDFAEEVMAALGRWQAYVTALITELPAEVAVPLRRVGAR
ncbi:tyrosine-type recombinase/integrase [Rhodopila sp.]|uniref:tyrosine-type recombinase/integrase n=1 Tax=Rhodopila sp. TaxID=2480087 RepID=UPI003D0B65D0